MLSSSTLSTKMRFQSTNNKALHVLLSALVLLVTKEKIVKSILTNVYLQEFVTMELAKMKSILISAHVILATMELIVKSTLMNVKVTHVSMDNVLMELMIFLVNVHLDGLVKNVILT